MRAGILLLVLLIATGVVYVDALPTVEWHKNYMIFPGLNAAYGLFVRNKIFVVGTSSDTAYLLGLELNGKMFLTMIYEQKGPDVFNDVYATGDYIYMVGRTSVKDIILGYMPKFLIMKIDYEGKILWSVSKSYGYGYGICVTKDRVIAVGASGFFLAYDGWLIICDHSGNVLVDVKWKGDYADLFSDVACSGNYIYVVGCTNSYGNGGYDILLVKYDMNGNMIWNKTYGGAGNEIGEGIYVDRSSIYIVGYEGDDVIVLACDLDGNLKWMRKWGGSGDDYGMDIVRCGDSIYVAGCTSSYGAGSFDVLLLRYTLDGDLKWYFTWGTSSSERGYGIAYCLKKLYVVGSIDTSKIFVLCMDISHNLTVNLPTKDFWCMAGGINKTGKKVAFNLIEGSYQVKVPEILSLDDERYVFNEWSDGETDATRTIELEDDLDLTAEYTRQFYVRVASPYGTTSGEGWYDEGSTATISVSSTTVDQGNYTKRIFLGWKSGGVTVSTTPTYTFTVNQPYEFTAEWKTRYYVQVISEYGTPTGTGWYDKGSTATVSISTTKVEGIPFNKVFKGWRDQSGSIVSTSSTYTFTVNQPVTLTAVWEQELNMMVVLAGVAVIVIIILIAVIAKSRKPKERVYVPPPPPPP